MTAYKESVGGDTEQIFGRIYLTDFNTAWQASLDALKDYPFEISSRESGFIQTKWVDNTSQKNFIDSFGRSSFYLKAQFRFRVNISKGFYNGRPSVKVSVQKEQLIQYDVLEGWRPVVTDGVDERTLLYRVGRLVLIQMKLQRLEDQRIQEQLRKEERIEEEPEPPPPEDFSNEDDDDPDPEEPEPEVEEEALARSREEESSSESDDDNETEDEDEDFDPDDDEDTFDDELEEIEADDLDEFVEE